MPAPKPRARTRAPRTFGHAKAAAFYEVLKAADPEPRTELLYDTPFQLVVAVALSAQATDVSVNKATRQLFADAPDAAAMARLGEDAIGERIRTIGLWRNKAKNVAALSAMILREFGGAVPETREDLMRLPGVGRKTANVVLNEAFGQPAIAVDTHIFRVSNRTGLAPGKTPDEVEQSLLRTTPDAYRRYAHHWLILHGRYVCKARKPECWRCPVREMCRYRPKTPDTEAGAGG